MISVVIPTHNRRAMLIRCLEAIQRQTLAADRWEVIVVDDGSSDGTPEAVASLSPNVANMRFIRQPQQGPAAARNAGIREARGDLVAFTDDDCVPTETWLADLSDAFPADAGVAGVGGAILRLENAVVSQYLDGEEYFQHHVGTGVWKYLVTANACFRRSVLLEVGGFDISFPTAGGEDAHLGSRVAAAGYTFVCVPGARVFHQHPTRLFQLYRMSVRYGKANLLLMRKLRMECHIPGIVEWMRHGLRASRRVFGKARGRPLHRLSFALCAIVSEFGTWQGQRMQR